VVNCSFGVDVSAEELAELNKLPLWDLLQRKGVTLVCAAGNGNVNIDRHPVFPASLPRANVIAVGATDAAGRPGTQYDRLTKKWTPFTNYGKTIDKKTPGTLILGATERGKTKLLNGTSYSAAMVSALEAFKH
jgi:subtilisin family serine protease